jgi:hypothetical protein
MPPATFPTVNGQPQDPYCHFMYRLDPHCAGPFEEEKRAPPTTGPGDTCTRNFGGEYAPFLLPSGYEKYDNSKGTVTLYYSLSTTNPYQTVLMDLTVNLH